MQSLRRLMRIRWSGGLLAVAVAYSLAIQALMASVGLGMSAAGTMGQADFAICSHVPGPSAQAPAAPDDRQLPKPDQQCPFCFVAAQSAGAVAMLAPVSALPAYSGLPVAGLLDGRLDDTRFVPAFRRTVGDPRAPPQFFV
jgi:hypothetical protein